MTLSPAQAMGAMTTMTTHELQNILAIIRESAGLMGDILEVNANVALKHRPKLDEALGHITTQVDRAKSLLEAMNRIGHAPDAAQQESCDLGLHTRALVQLCGRPARLKELSLQFSPPSQPLPIHASALQVVAEGFTVLRAAIEVCPSGSVLEIALHPGPQAHSLMLALPTPPPASSLLSALANAGRIQLQGTTIQLSFPAHHP